MEEERAVLQERMADFVRNHLDAVDRCDSTTEPANETEVYITVSCSGELMMYREVANEPDVETFLMDAMELAIGSGVHLIGWAKAKVVIDPESFKRFDMTDHSAASIRFISKREQEMDEFMTALDRLGEIMDEGGEQ